ncbi:MAG TPA: hypothetical protein VGD87_09525, partial [Archangium sp.]
MLYALLAAGFLVPLFSFLLTLFVVVPKFVAGKARKVISARFSPSEIVASEDMANCFGFTSKGPLANRGNGGLVLTRDTLWFLPLVGAEWSVPLAKLTRVEEVRSHLGKNVGRALL